LPFTCVCEHFERGVWVNCLDKDVDTSMTANSTIIDAHVTHLCTDPLSAAQFDSMFVSLKRNTRAHHRSRLIDIAASSIRLWPLRWQKARPCQASFYSSPHSFPATTCTPPHPLSQSFYFSTLIAARPVFDSWRNQKQYTTPLAPRYGCRKGCETMASGFDGLVERLLYDVALAGTGGQSILMSRAIKQLSSPDSILTNLQASVSKSSATPCASSTRIKGAPKIHIKSRKTKTACSSQKRRQTMARSSTITSSSLYGIGCRAILK
jgi:hypothetical protein